MRSCAAAAALGVPLLLAAAGPAGAATIQTPNSCRYNFDQYYRDTPVTITGGVAAGTTSPTAAGTRITVDGGPIGIALPENLARLGYISGLLAAGENVLPITVYVAIAASNTTEQVQVVGPIELTARTTITVDPNDDGRFSGATPFLYDTPTLPSTTWTATGAGDVVARQAGANALGTQPVGAGGAPVPLAGSVAVKAVVKDGFSFVMDCQPGRTLEVSPVDLAGPKFAPAAIVWPFAGVPGPAGTAPAGVVGSTKLTAARSGRVKLSVACADAAVACAGTAVLRGSAGAGVTRAVRYTAPAGKTTSLTLKLTPAGAKLLARKRSRTVTASLTPAQGAAATRSLVLRRR